MIRKARLYAPNVRAQRIKSKTPPVTRRDRWGTHTSQFSRQSPGHPPASDLNEVNEVSAYAKGPRDR